MLASEIHYPDTVQDLVEQMRRRPDSAIYAGGTEILRRQSETYARLPREVLCVAGMAELRQVLLTERFVEIGAAVTLAEILELRENAVPELLALSLRSVGNPAVRNLATIGGNLATTSRFMDSWPALACLDAMIELRDADGARWINVNRLASPDGSPDFPRGNLLTRIRLPLEGWDFVAFRKVGVKDYPARESAAFAFATRADKGILSEFRLAFAGEAALRMRDIEGMIVGRRLPLEARQVAAFAEEYRAAAQILPPRQRLQFGTLVAGALDLLTR